MDQELESKEELFKEETRAAKYIQYVNTNQEKQRIETEVPIFG